MKCAGAKELMAESWQRQPERAAALRLEEHLASCQECSNDYAALGGLWKQMGDLPAPEPGNALRARWDATLAAALTEQRKPPRNSSFSDFFSANLLSANFWRRGPVWQAAIALGCLLIGLLIGNSGSRNLAANQNRELAKLHEEIAATRAMVALSLLRQQSATQRLSGIDYSGRMPTLQPEIVAALLQAVSSDPSVNVRLAAIDALGKVAGKSGVLGALTASLPKQDSPMVQAALIDFFVDAGDRQSVAALRQLEGQTNLNPAILERTRSALRELSQ